MKQKRTPFFWKWVPNRKYTTALTYKIQFQSSYNPTLLKLWKAKVKLKVKFFASTGTHEKVLTSANLATRGMQHNPIYPLC
jgi:hypothetical protein